MALTGRMYLVEIKIRQATEADIDDLVELLGALFFIEADFNFDTEKQRRGLCLLLAASTACVLVAEYENAVIGMCTAQTLISTAQGGRVGLVEDVVVKEVFRSRGVGRRLLNALEAWCKARGFTRIQLLADQNNSAALGFYDKAGWGRTDLICLRKMMA